MQLSGDQPRKEKTKESTLSFLLRQRSHPSPLGTNFICHKSNLPAGGLIFSSRTCSARGLLPHSPVEASPPGWGVGITWEHGLSSRAPLGTGMMWFLYQVGPSDLQFG